MVAPGRDGGPQPAPSGKHLHGHGPLVEREVARAREPFHAHRLLEVPGLHGNVVVETVAQVHVLHLDFIVGEVQVELGKPLLIKRGLQGKARTADVRPVVEAEPAVVFLQVVVGFGTQPVHRRGGMIERNVGVNPVVQFQAEIIVFGGKIQFAFLEIDVRPLPHGLSPCVGLGKRPCAHCSKERHDNQSRPHNSQFFRKSKAVPFPFHDIWIKIQLHAPPLRVFFHSNKRRALQHDENPPSSPTARPRKMERRLAESRIVLSAKYSSTCRRVRRRTPQATAQCTRSPFRRI